MPKKKLELLTEPMFYILTALTARALCGTEIARAAEIISNGRIAIGPATLYTALGKFLDAGYIEEVLPSAPGRVRTYRLTESGRAAWLREFHRMTLCISDAMRGNEDLLSSRGYTGTLPAEPCSSAPEETDTEALPPREDRGNGTEA